MSLFKSTATIGFYTLISRVLGFVRDMTIAGALGASMLSDAFFVSFKIPNFLRRLFAEGAFNAAFVPLYAGTLAEPDGQEKAKLFADEAYSFLVAVLLCVSVVFVLFMPWFMLLLAPGFRHDPGKYELTVMLTRITFPYIIFISVVSLLGGILNSMGKFAAVAATPIIMNLCLIIIPFLIKGQLPTPAHDLAVAVFVAGVAQMLWLMWFSWKLRVMPRLHAPRLSAEVKRLLLLIAPAAAGAGVAQINLFIDLIIASHLDTGVSYLYYADRLNELPLAVIGIAIGTVLLPSLSKQIREGDVAGAKASQNRAIDLALLFALPAAAALMTISEPLIRVLYERGAFSPADTANTHVALIAFAAGLPAFVLIKVLAPAFYANRDTKTPFRIALICIAVNLVLNLLLIGPFRHVGMAMATSIAGWLNVVLMLWNLKKRDLFVPDHLLLTRATRLLLACSVMAFGLAILQHHLWAWFAAGIFSQVAGLTILVLGGAGIYFFGASCLQAYDMSALKRLRKK